MIRTSIYLIIAILIAGSTLWWPTPVRAADSGSTEGAGHVKFLCPVRSHCQGEGAFVAERFAQKADLRIELYDTKPSTVLPGYYHISMRTEDGGPMQIVVTNGLYMIPSVLPVSPVRIGDPRFLKEKIPTNLFFKEEEGMYVAPPVLKEAILMARGKKGYILVADALWGKDFADLVDLINEVYASRKEEVPSLYLVPFFGFMSKYTLRLGRYYYALTEDLKCDPLNVAYNFSRAGHEVKAFSEPLFQMALELLIGQRPGKKEEELRKELRRALARWTENKVVTRTAEILGKSRLGLVEHVVLINDRIYHFPSLLGKNDVSVKEHFRPLLP